VVFALTHDTVLITDGGLATELEARGHNLSTSDLSAALWSARLLIDAPDEIISVHEAFFRAGADFATTASYQASFDGFATHGIDAGDARRLMRRSVELAQTARDEVGGGWVAASVGPYGAALADGSEYRGRYGLTVKRLIDWHRPRMEVLAEAGADVLALETIPDLDEADALRHLLPEFGMPAWLSFTIDGPNTRAGQSLADGFALADEAPEIIAVGVNCCSPADVLPAIEIARTMTTKPVIVYPNSGERWDALRRSWAGPSTFTAEPARRWAAAGARIIGGCCRVRPADIAELSGVLRG
jgi:homocysteine S-methyltransferase